MKILVIGGSYFLGRVFTIIASKDHELTLVNRGKYSMKQFGVREYVANRYDATQIAKLPEENFDVVVDFCAYNPMDIECLVNKTLDIFSHVYPRDTGNSFPFPIEAM
jgi:hypothetical protein